MSMNPDDLHSIVVAMCRENGCTCTIQTELTQQADECYVVQVQHEPTCHAVAIARRDLN